MKIFILGDLHFPFHHKAGLEKVLKEIEKEKPTHVVQIGDLYDQYCFSKYTKRMYLEAKKELVEANQLAKDMWKRIRKSSKNPKCIQILGNHDVRALKRVEERYRDIQEIFLDSMREYYVFDGVDTAEDDRDTRQISNILIHHGFLSKLGDHMRYFGSNVIVGHSHSGGVVVEQRNGKNIWELNVGYLADESQEPLRYRPTKTCKWTLGYGVVDETGPRFVSL